MDKTNYKRGKTFKDRGIEKVESYFEDFLNLISKKIDEKGKIKILDAGCGEGIAMAGFIKRFGNKIEIIGFNYSKKDGCLEKLKRELLKRNIFVKKELNKIKNLPKFIYCDANKKLPFKNNEFDFIYSMATLYLLKDKVGFLEECNRILKNGGIARIGAAFNPHITKMQNSARHYNKVWEIWDKGKEIKIWDYTRRIKGVKSVWRSRFKKNKPQYIEIKKQSKLNFKLNLVTSIDYNLLWDGWVGIKSIYAVQLK
ncbi:MAG: class I SAM-dependent methyltransferase [Candidatus Pacearchaeota archaeon]|jgi:ubiquinone/menaquinone biosynthesis C-methylase UbiE